MKKSVVFTFILALLIVMFAGCSESNEKVKPEDVSEVHYKYGLKALEIVDGYLDFDISAEVTSQKIEALMNEGWNLPETEHPDNILVEHNILMISFEAAKINRGVGSYDDLLKQRNSLANLLDEKAR